MFRSSVKVLIAVGVVFLSSYILEITLHRDGVPGQVLLLLSSLLVGVVAGALMYVLSARERQREAFIECRLRVIAEMNHHIRNALQVITFYNRKGNKQEVGIAEAVERIQWALREVLPQLPDFAEQHEDMKPPLAPVLVKGRNQNGNRELLGQRFRSFPIIFPRPQ